MPESRRMKKLSESQNSGSFFDIKSIVGRVIIVKEKCAVNGIPMTISQYR